MISSGDKEYLDSKDLRKGLLKLNSPFSDLAHLIEIKYGVKPLNIVYDIIEHNKSPRLQIIFEKLKDNIPFKAENGLFPNTERQIEIQNIFGDLIQNEKKYSANNLLVLFSAFEPLAKEEANGKISIPKLQKLKGILNDFPIWTIEKSFSTGIFFFFTDEQLAKYNNNETINIFKNEYLKLIKEFDEFGYIDEMDFSVKFDSKENFDKNFQSNWFYYFR